MNAGVWRNEIVSVNTVVSMDIAIKRIDTVVNENKLSQNTVDRKRTICLAVNFPTIPRSSNVAPLAATPVTPRAHPGVILHDRDISASLLTSVS